MITLAQHLRVRSERSFRALAGELEGVSSDDARRYYSTSWPDHRWGVGQNGSIAGIVYHVAAWKQMTLPLFEPGGKPQSREEFDADAAPAPDDWPAITAWLNRIGTEWNARMVALADSEFDSNRDWEGSMLPISSFVVEMMEHDIQHASQIAYIKQMLASERNSLPP